MVIPKPPASILLDLDGTLTDSVPDLCAAGNHVLAELGLPIRDEDEARQYIGNGVERFMKRMLTGRLEAEPTAVDFAAVMERFNAYYQANVAVHTTLFPGVREGLEVLAGVAPLGVITNKASSFTRALLEHFGLTALFGVVVAGDTLARKKPDPLPLQHACATLGATPSASLMVGDSRHDVTAARAAGMAVVCVSYGYNHGEPIAASNPDAIIDRLTDLPRVWAQD